MSVEGGRRRLIEVSGVQLRRESSKISMEVGAGEVLGLAGLDGQGQEAFLALMAGLYRPVAGAVTVFNRAGEGRSIRSFGGASRAGIAYLPRDRKGEGILPTLSVLENFAVASIAGRGLARRAGWREYRGRLKEFQSRLGIVASSPKTRITGLSGGNQQKVLVARLLLTGPRAMLLDDPGRGVDPGTKVLFHRFFRELADESGMAIVLLSTELEELVKVCDRVAVFRKWELVTTVQRNELSVAVVLAGMFGRGGAGVIE